MTSNSYIEAIGANLAALRSILTAAIQDADNGLEALERGEANGAVGSILPTESLLAQATTLIHAILVLHRL